MVPTDPSGLGLSPGCPSAKHHLQLLERIAAPCRRAWVGTVTICQFVLSQYNEPNVFSSNCNRQKCNLFNTTTTLVCHKQCICSYPPFFVSFCFGQFTSLPKINIKIGFLVNVFQPLELAPSSPSLPVSEQGTDFANQRLPGPQLTAPTPSLQNPPPD